MQQYLNLTNFMLSYTKIIYLSMKSMLPNYDKALLVKLDYVHRSR